MESGLNSGEQWLNSENTLFSQTKFSNQTWLCHFPALKVQILNRFGTPIGLPSIALYFDILGTNVVGFYVGTRYISQQMALALALRQAILPKQLFDKDAWVACGQPCSLLSYSKSNFSLISPTAQRLCIKCYFAKLSDDWRRQLRLFNYSLLHCISHSVSYKEDYKEVTLTKQELEQVIIRFIKQYNQQMHPEHKHYTRTQSWEVGLANGRREIPTERSLDICLPRSGSRLVCRKGCVRFEGQIYRDEVLASHVGEYVFLRYNPQDITTVFVFQQQGREEILLSRARILNFQEESLPLEDAKAISQQRNGH